MADIAKITNTDGVTYNLKDGSIKSYASIKVGATTLEAGRNDNLELAAGENVTIEVTSTLTAADVKNTILRDCLTRYGITIVENDALDNFCSFCVNNPSYTLFTYVSNQRNPFEVQYRLSNSYYANGTNDYHFNTYGSLTIASTYTIWQGYTGTNQNKQNCILLDTVNNFVTIIPKVTINSTNTTYSDATTSAAGLMSATDKLKLDDISEGANKVESSATNGNIKIDNTETKVYDDSEIKQDLSTDTATVTGNPLNFTTLSAQKAVETVISLEPIQDLHGYDHPWPEGGGKNKLPMTVDGIKAVNTSGGTWSENTFTRNGVSFTILTDDGNNVIGILVNGTASSATDLYLFGSYGSTTAEILSGTYTLSSMPSSILINIGYSNTIVMQALTTEQTGSLENGASWAFIRINSGVSVSNIVAYPMIRLATETDPTFAPYSNYCPIDGRTETSLVGTNGKESTDPDYIESNNLTIQFGEKVYGATVELEKGTVTVDREIVDMGTLTWTYDASRVGKDFFRASLNPLPKRANTASSVANVVCSSYQSASGYDVYNHTIIPSCGIPHDNNIVMICDTAYTDAATFKTAMSGVQLCYELATPRTITLTPNEISLLSGVNNISTDGDSIKLTYRGGKVATLGDLEDAANNLQEQIDQNETMEDETTQLLYKLGVNNGLLFMEEV